MLNTSMSYKIDKKKSKLCADDAYIHKNYGYKVKVDTNNNLRELNILHLSQRIFRFVVTFPFLCLSFYSSYIIYTLS